jgi:CDGSH-type Zn-finger protein
MVEPIVAGKAPMGIDVEAGKSYYWCSCGASKNQPFCDGGHKGSGFVPLKYDATTTGKVWFCTCKHSANSPLCDGSHKQLP